MLRKELLDARKALRSVGEGESGPRSKKQRGELEPLSIQSISSVLKSCKQAEREEIML